MRCNSWTSEETTLLIEQIEIKAIRPGLVTIGNRTPNAIKDQIAYLRAEGKITRRFKTYTPSKSYTLDEIKLIRKHTVEANGDRLGPLGLSMLPELQGRNAKSLGGAINRYGLADQKASQCISDAKRLSSEEKDRLLFFLQNEGRYWPTPIVEEKFGISSGVITRIRNINNLIFNHAQASHDPVYLAWFKSKEHKRAKRLQENLAERARYTKYLLLVFKDLMYYETQKPPKKRCLNCRTELYATEKFFQYKKRYREDGSSFYSISSFCLACPDRKKK